MLSLKSSGMYPDLYILLISLVIICIPFSPMHCSSSAETLSLPQAFPFDRSLITLLFATDCIYLVLHLTHINDIIYSSVFILIQFFHILSPSLHYFIFFH